MNARSRPGWSVTPGGRAECGVDHGPGTGLGREVEREVGVLGRDSARSCGREPGPGQCGAEHGKHKV